MTRRRRRGWLVVVVVAILLLIAIWWLRTRIPQDFGPPQVAVQSAELPAIGAFELYFGDPALAGLRREVRFLSVTGNLEDDARAVIEALLRGSQRGGVSPWSAGTVLQDLFISAAGEAFVFFDDAVRRRAAAGDFIEWLRVASLTRTLCGNFPEVRGVRILVEGESSGPFMRTMPLEWTYTPDMFREDE